MGLNHTRITEDERGMTIEIIGEHSRLVIGRVRIDLANGILKIPAEARSLVAVPFGGEGGKPHRRGDDGWVVSVLGFDAERRLGPLSYAVDRDTVLELPVDVGRGGQGGEIHRSGGGGSGVTQ